MYAVFEMYEIQNCKKQKQNKSANWNWPARVFKNLNHKNGRDKLTSSDIRGAEIICFTHATDSS